MDILITFRTFCNRPRFFCPIYLLITYNFVCFSFGIKKFIEQKHNFWFEKNIDFKLQLIFSTSI